MKGSLLVTGASGHPGLSVLHHLTETLSVPASRIVTASRNVIAKGTNTGFATIDFGKPSTRSQGSAKTPSRAWRRQSES
ncbi:hypothetical protein [Agrobacterium vitis]|uniref:hypothetical protein n=1 Tax=Agrobacterium vitis TaxID=373 RepID=UPI002E32305D|nr:hypothetical protein [Agrobacterium vitis]